MSHTAHACQCHMLSLSHSAPGWQRAPYVLASAQHCQGPSLESGLFCSCSHLVHCLLHTSHQRFMPKAWCQGFFLAPTQHLTDIWCVRASVQLRKLATRHLMKLIIERCSTHPKQKQKVLCWYKQCVTNKIITSHTNHTKHFEHCSTG